MRLNAATMGLVTYMVLAILLAGSISAWPWLGLLIAVMLRSYHFPHSITFPPANQAHQGPHFLRRTSARRLDLGASAE